MNNKNLLLLTACILNLCSLQAEGPSKCGTDLITLTVGTDFSGTLGNVPFEQLVNGQLTGFDIAVASEIAHRLGFQSITFRQISATQDSQKNPFPLLNELNKPTSQLDIGIRALSIIPRPTALGSETTFSNISFVTYNDDIMGAVISSQADAKYSNGSTYLETINNDSNTVKARADTTILSREFIIMFPIVVGITNRYENITAVFDANLTQSVTRLNDQLADVTISPDKPFLLTNNASAQALIGNPDAFPQASVRLIPNVVDTKNIYPSQGLGIAVGGISEDSEACDQLLANVAQAVKDMVVDGTLARLREEFNVTSSDDKLGTISTQSTTAPNINSNVVYNFLFSKYGKATVIIGTSVPFGA